MPERNSDNAPPHVPDRFSGTARLYGPSGFERLQRASVLIVGIGGVGSWTAEALARTGVGRLTLMDLDDICQTNINRQVHATDPSVGRFKVEEMAARIATIAPDCRVAPLLEFLKPESVRRTLESPYDLVIDAIDSVPVKIALLADALRLEVPIVTVGAAGGRRDACATESSTLDKATHDPLLRAVRKGLRREDPSLPLAGAQAIFSKEPRTVPEDTGQACSPQGLHCEFGYGSAAHVTGAFGLAAAGVAIERIVSGPQE